MVATVPSKRMLVINARTFKVKDNWLMPRHTTALGTPNDGRRSLQDACIDMCACTAQKRSWSGVEQQTKPTMSA
jgi:hypothetical protein